MASALAQRLAPVRIREPLAYLLVGEPAGRAVIAVLAYRAISFWLPTLPGIGGYVTLRSTVRGWRMADEAIREGLDGGPDAREALRDG